MKKGRLTKGRAFWAGLASLLAMEALVAWRAPQALAEITPGMALAIVGLVGAFAGFNVADNFQRSKYYKPELSKEEVCGGSS
jgi:hypothetical protein